MLKFLHTQIWGKGLVVDVAIAVGSPGTLIRSLRSDQTVKAGVKTDVGFVIYDEMTKQVFHSAP